MKSKIIEILNKLLDYNILLGNQYKVTAYQNAINSLKNFEKKITINNYTEIPIIGDKIRRKIKEILLTGELNEIKKINIVSKLFRHIIKIPGFGVNMGKKILGDMKITKIEDIPKYYKLNAAQKLGFEYRNKINIKIPYKEGEKLIKKILNLNKGRNIVPCGSYRRKKKFLGDIDLLLFDDGQIILPDNTIVINQGKKKASVICELKKNSYAHVDIRYIGMDSFVTAILYFTGSREFNIRMRIQAKKLGYKLNEYELSKNGTRIELNDEKELFKILKMKYLEPYERN